MWKFIRGTLVALGALAFTGGLAAIATNYTVTQGSGTTFGSIVVGGVNYAQQFLCDLTTPAQCAKVSSAGSQQVGGEGTAGSPAGGVVSVQGVGSGTALPVSAASLPLPALAATSTKQSDGSQKSQIVDGSGNVIASTSNNLNVQCANCSGSGASATDGATFTVGTSVFGPAGGEFTTGGATACATGKQCLVGMTAARGFLTDTSTVNGVTVLTGTGAVGTGAQRVAVGTDTATIAGSAPGTAGSPSTNVVSVQGVASGTTIPVTAGAGTNVIGYTTGDPCSQGTRINKPISQTTSTNLITGTSAKKLYICAISLITADAENISFVEGTTGGTCGTSTAAVIGSTTAANGMNLAANGGFTIGSGLGSVANTATNANDLCLFQSGSGRIAGNLMYVVQ